MLRSLCIAALILAGGVGPARAQPRAPLISPAPGRPSAEMLRAIKAIRQDPRPRALTQHKHYVVSNEVRQYLYHGVVAPMGGVYVGVGAEQNYLFAGWSRPELMLLVDFDQTVAQLHQIYNLLLSRADTPEAFLALWTPASSPAVVGWIQAMPIKPWRRQQLAELFGWSRRLVHRRLGAIKWRYTKERVPTFLTDQRQYDHIATLARNHRIHAFRGDFTGDRTLRDVAAFCRKFNLPVRVLYLSNVESYFPYARKRFRQNIIDLPFAPRSVVLHTLPWSKTRYYYIYQTGPNYQAWLNCCCVDTYKYLVSFAAPMGHKDRLAILRRPGDFRKLKRWVSPGTCIRER